MQVKVSKESQNAIQIISAIVIIILGGIFLLNFIDKKIDENDTQEAQAALQASNTLSSTPTPTAPVNDPNIGQYANLETEDTLVGTGKEAQNGNKLTMNYTGKLPDGTVFDSSLNEGREPFVFTLGAGNVIEGWDQGILGMKEEGKRILKIPSSLGYGEFGSGAIIKPNYDLYFEVELLKVE